MQHEGSHAHIRLRDPTNAASHCAQVSFCLINKPHITSEHLVINIQAITTDRKMLIKQ